MSPRSPSRPGSERRSSGSDTSNNPLGSIGTWTRRPSVVTTTATGRRSWRSKRPKLASKALVPRGQAVRWAKDSTVRARVNVSDGHVRRERGGADGASQRLSHQRLSQMHFCDERLVNPCPNDGSGRSGRRDVHGCTGCASQGGTSQGGREVGGQTHVASGQARVQGTDGALC